MADDLSSWALVFLTVALVGATLYYAIQTGKLAKLQNDTLVFERERYKTEQRPELFFTLKPVGIGGAVSPEITNVGKTPAKDILIEINGIPGTAQEKSNDPKIMGKFFGRWTIPTMLPGEGRILNLVTLDSSSLGGLYAIEMKATLHDMYQVPSIQSPQSIPTSLIIDVLWHTAPSKK
jgi:hypothetical protein